MISVILPPLNRFCNFLRTSKTFPQMEVTSEDGTQIRLKPGQTKELGRSNGFKSSDNTISRRHISFFIPIESNSQEIHLQFEVLGINPIYVSKDNEVKIFRRFERGEMGDGDMFCVSAKSPVWYTVRKFQNCSEGVRRNALESELKESLENDSGFEGVECLHEVGVDFSRIDPVKEFGFVVEGHEFDSYPKKMIKSFKDWEWFLEEEKGKDSEDDDEEGKKGKSRWRRKRKKGTENDYDDDEWSGESEDDKVLMNKSTKGQRPKYKTRSKDHGTDASKRKKKSPTRAKNREIDDEDEEDEDETLGGFIVDDENLEDAKEEEEEEEGLGDEDEEEEE